MNYKLEISRNLKGLEERRYAAIVSLWFDTYLKDHDEVYEAEFVLKALKNQTTWMSEPFKFKFYCVDNLAMVMRESDGSVILSILVLTK